MKIKTLYSIDEVVLIPAKRSRVASRKECWPYYSIGPITRNWTLPIFIAPMSCLVDEHNYSKLKNFGFNVILPRTVSLEKRLADLQIPCRWVAFGLEELHQIELLRKEGTLSSQSKFNICIDIANGHQSRAISWCQVLKTLFPKCTIMVGNVANPETYREYAKAGVDYVRLGIGSGHVCTTSVQTGIHYPMASLIAECRRIKDRKKYKTAIVADGGFRYIDQLVKGLALGADYIMIGRIAAGFPEACGQVNENNEREYYGMSTEKAQRLMHPEADYVPRHTEGTVRWVPIMENTRTWIDDFTHALKSSMSYCNAFDLSEFKGRVKWAIQNPVTFNAYIKS